MKYIDADKLIAEIERLKSVLADPLCSQGNILGPDWVAGGNKMLKEISTVITSLQQEQPEVILTDGASFVKELKRFLSDTGNEKKRGGVVLPIIKHFYELGLNARKEETK